MPDAMGKTIPIWCAVMNRTLFPDKPAYHAVQFAPAYLGESEESQIESKIDGFRESFRVSISPWYHNFMFHTINLAR